MPQGVLIIGEVKRLNRVAEGKPQGPREFTVRETLVEIDYAVEH